MTKPLCLGSVAMAATTLVLCVALALSEEPPEHSGKEAKGRPTAASGQPADREAKVSVAVARERAQLMHNIYAATLDVMHHHFFRSDRAVLPARAMEDVFAEMARQSSVRANWIAVNTKAMSIHHEPQSDFEKQAALELADGKEDFESVENGYYQRAGRIPLGVGCVSCHTNQLASPSKSPRFAGLVIRIPVAD